MTGPRHQPSRPRASSGSGPGSAKGPVTATEIDRIAHRIAQQPVRLRSGDGTREVPAAEAILLATAKSAGEGNSHAAWLMLEQFRRAEERLAADDAELRALAASFRLGQTLRIARAKAAGEDATRILPHPDDIDPDHPGGARITGPSTDAEWDAALRSVRVREAWLLQHALDRSLDASDRKARRKSGRKSGRATQAGAETGFKDGVAGGTEERTGAGEEAGSGDGGAVLPGMAEEAGRHGPGTGGAAGRKTRRARTAAGGSGPGVIPGDALCMAQLAELSLPTRLRRGPDGMVSRMMDLSALTQRALLKQSRAAWAAAGMDLPRGTRAPPPGQMLAVLGAGARAVREVLSPGFDPRDVEAVAADMYDEVIDIIRAWRGRPGEAGGGTGGARGGHPGGGSPGGGNSPDRCGPGHRPSLPPSFPDTTAHSEGGPHGA